jgi:hypothetical protein
LKQGVHQLAERVASLLQAGDAASVAELLHYPPSYSEVERTADVAEVQKVLVFLIDRFGLPTDLKVNDAPLTFYEFGSSGGTVEYWASISPLETRAFMYSASFSKLGPGLLQIHLFQPADQSTLELQRVGFGLAASSPSARATMISTIVDLQKHMGRPVPPNYVEMLEQGLQPSSFQPPEEE